jgi:hypothetical protein
VVDVVDVVDVVGGTVVVGTVVVTVGVLDGLYTVAQSTKVDWGAVGQAKPDEHHVCC